jgi:ParB-like chromosome segregation protein Spo0J
MDGTNSVSFRFPEPTGLKIVRDVFPVARVLVDELDTADSPRLNGLDQDHVRRLAEMFDALPPIIVREAGMSVVDGLHRVAAARLLNVGDIQARFFHGTADEAFRLAVEQNVAHGLPLSTADRQMAAERLIRANLERSDRALGRTTGLAANTVAAIRRRVAGVESATPRLGQDGRVRPLSTADGRLLASRVMSEHPDASLRDVARAAGISVGTVRDVRDRLRAGRDPVPAKQRQHRPRIEAEARLRVDRQPPKVDISSLLDGLRCDPSLRYSVAGREFLRWLGSRIPDGHETNEIGRRIPPHAGVVVAKVARECARMWLELAEEMEDLGKAAV